MKISIALLALLATKAMAHSPEDVDQLRRQLQDQVDTEVDLIRKAKGNKKETTSPVDVAAASATSCEIMPLDARMLIAKVSLTQTTMLLCRVSFCCCCCHCC